VYSLYGWQQSVEEARTVAFTVLVVVQLVHAFNCRSERLSIFQVGLLTNRALLWAVLLSLAMQLAVLSLPAARPIFKVAPLPIEDWERIAAVVLLPLIFVEAAKWIKRR
jgi:Ca2+-transporting ATPase